MAKHMPLFRPQEPLECILPRVENWYLGDQGQRLLNSEKTIISKQLQNCFGYHLVQLSISNQFTLFQDSSVNRNYLAHPFLNQQHDHVDVCCEYDALPFETDSVDVVILHHAHEFSQNPHDVLREIQRIITPRGHLIIAGFNPWSLQTLFHMAKNINTTEPWQQHWLSRKRIADWLGLLGFHVTGVKYVFPQASLNCDGHKLDSISAAVREQIIRTPFGASYIISAIKDVRAITPTRPNWLSITKSLTGRLSPVNPARSKEVA